MAAMRPRESLPWGRVIGTASAGYGTRTAGGAPARIHFIGGGDGMCILCEHEALDRLTTPLSRFAPGELAEAIRTARDAAGPGIMDHAESVLRGEAQPRVGPDFFGEVVVARAREAGVLSAAASYEWDVALKRRVGSADPRVQAFLSACAEIVDEYVFLHAERRAVLERFVEARGDRVEFAWLGRDGELWYDWRGDLYLALTESEALEIVERELSGRLHELEPEILLRYTALPETGLEVLAGILAKPAEVADGLLSGIIDLPALADDRVRTEGFAPYLQVEEVGPLEDLRFGEWIIVRATA